MSNPLAEPLFRYGVGIMGAITIAVVGVLFLEGIARYAAFAMAVVDAVVTPKILESAVESSTEPA